MTPTETLVDGFQRVRGTVHDTVEGLTAAQLAARLDPEANTIAWLVWHLTRIQDDHVASAAGTTQVWREGWSERFGLPFDESATGYGQGGEEVAAVRPRDGGLLLDYYDAVHERTVAYLERLTAEDLDRVVDDAWDPPVTLGVRLVSVISDDLQHVGQAAFVKGIVCRTG